MNDEKTEPPKGHKPPHRRFRNWLIDFVIALIVVLPIGKIFEYFTTKNELAHLLHFQEHLYAAVSQLDPAHLFGYLFVPAGFLHPHIDGFLRSFLSEGIAEGVWKILILPLLALGLALLPVIIVVRGTVEECVIVLGFYIPLAALLTGGFKRGDANAGGLIIALLVTVLLFWGMQMVMLGALYAFGGFLRTAQSWAGSAFFTSAVYWCAVKGTEHSVTERVLHAVFRKA